MRWHPRRSHARPTSPCVATSRLVQRASRDTLVVKDTTVRTSRKTILDRTSLSNPGLDRNSRKKGPGSIGRRNRNSTGSKDSIENERFHPLPQRRGPGEDKTQGSTLPLRVVKDRQLAVSSDPTRIQPGFFGLEIRISKGRVPVRTIRTKVSLPTCHPSTGPQKDCSPFSGKLRTKDRVDRLGRRRSCKTVGVRTTWGGLIWTTCERTGRRNGWRKRRQTRVDTSLLTITWIAAALAHGCGGRTSHATHADVASRRTPPSRCAVGLVETARDRMSKRNRPSGDFGPRIERVNEGVSKRTVETCLAS